jgi:hypothetical protein
MRIDPEMDQKQDGCVGMGLIPIAVFFHVFSGLPVGQQEHLDVALE